MNISQIYQKFNETIYGNTAIVYHRTNVEELPKLLQSGEKFISGEGNTYGDGMYSTFDLQNALIGDETKNIAGTKKYGERYASLKAWHLL
jgi:hypothetical protein